MRWAITRRLKMANKGTGGKRGVVYYRGEWGRVNLSLTI